MTVSLLLALAFPLSTVMASTAMEVEANRGTKTQQHINGVRSPEYWFASFLWDQAVMFLTVVGATLAFDGYSSNMDRTLGFILIFLFFLSY